MCNEQILHIHTLPPPELTQLQPCIKNRLFKPRRQYCVAQIWIKRSNQKGIVLLLYKLPRVMLFRHDADEHREVCTHNFASKLKPPGANPPCILRGEFTVDHHVVKGARNSNFCTTHSGRQAAVPQCTQASSHGIVSHKVIQVYHLSSKCNQHNRLQME